MYKLHCAKGDAHAADTEKSTPDDYVQVSTASWPASTARGASLITPSGATRSIAVAGSPSRSSLSSPSRRVGDNGRVAPSASLQHGEGTHRNDGLDRKVEENGRLHSHSVTGVSFEII